MKDSYQSRYTWSRTIEVDGISLFEHSNSVLSVAVEWYGLQTTLKDTHEINSLYKRYMKALHKLDHSDGITIENHYLRDYTSSIPEKYIEFGEKNIVRGHLLGKRIRQEQAEHISKISMESRVFTIFNIANKGITLSSFRIKKRQEDQINKAKRLLSVVHNITSDLKGSKILDGNDFKKIIWQCYHRDKARNIRIPTTSNRFIFSDIVASKPIYEDGFLKIGETYTKCILLKDYEDAYQDWFYKIARCTGLELHVTQIIKPLNTGAVIQSSASETIRSSQDASDAGAEDQALKIEDHNKFRMFVSKNKLRVFGNTYIIKLHGTNKEELQKGVDTFFDKVLTASSVRAEDLKEITYAVWRFSMPGMGYQTTFSRSDHSLQVVNMAPIITFDKGDPENMHMLRLSSDGQPITVGYPKEGVNHTLTAAKTGAGKGVETGSQIMEMYPLGVNFFITEVGHSYRWVVEGFEGQYFDLDTTTVVSPFPEFKLADTSKTFPLSGDIVGPTIGALKPLIAEGAKDTEHHVISVGEMIMQELYRENSIREEFSAPTLEHYLICAEASIENFEKDKDIKAATIIRDNLDSFLNRTSGSNFAKADSLSIDKGIAGFNFKGVMGDEYISKFLLVFLSLRFKQIAFANSEQTVILLDEFHEFVRIDTVLMTTLSQQLSRMGRKEASALHIITQETIDAALNVGIVNSMQHQNFMYLQSGHEYTRGLFNMNSNVMDRWMSFDNPDGLHYRQCIRNHGDQSWDLHLTFPETSLNITNTNSDVLDLKDEISILTNDPIERINLLKERLG